MIRKSMRLKQKAPIPFDFVLEELAEMEPMTRPMFGCHAIYVGEKIVLVLREKLGEQKDNGVWLATTKDRHSALQKIFPHMRSISIFGPEVTSWQVLPVDAPDFEPSVYQACELIKAGSELIGKVPDRKKKRPSKAPRAQKKVRRPSLHR